MQWYLVRNTSNSFQSVLDLLEHAAIGKYRLKGFGRLNSSEDIAHRYNRLGIFPPHSERTISILGTKDRGKGIVCKALRTGNHGPFLIRRIRSPRNIWTPVEALTNEEQES